VGNVKEIKDRVLGAIDKGTTAVEKVHQDIMHKPIEVLELIVPDLPLTKTVAEVQTKIIGIVYDVIRGVNHAVGEMADGVLRTNKRSPRETT
jgi:hypothetical protein